LRKIANQIRCFAVLLAACGLLALAAAEGPRSLETKVSEILLKFPASNSVEKDNLAASVLSLGPSGIRSVCRRLSPPGKEDDTLARFALDAMAVHVTRPGAEKERKAFAGVLGKALQSAADYEVKAFLIEEIQLTGGNESVDVLRRYLHDGALAGPAARALTAIRTPEAEDALLAALGASSGESRIAVIQALGEIQSLQAAGRILPHASSSDESLRKTALEALANIGDPSYESVLAGMPVASSPAERIRSASLYLFYADRLAESGRKDRSLAVSRNLLEKFTGSGEGQVRSQALSLIFEVLGDAALEDIIKAAASPDKGFRGRAMDLAARIPGEAATATWLAVLPDLPLESQAEVISMLGRRGDRSALDAVQGKLKSEERALRLAAIPASAALAGADGLDAIWPLVKTADEQEAAVIKSVLLRFPPETVLSRAARMIEEARPHGQAALIDILAEREAREYSGKVLPCAEGTDPVARRAALKALEKVVTPPDIPRIINLLLSTDDNVEILLLQNALAAAANLIADPETRAEALLEELTITPGGKRADLIRPLARIGGFRALNAVWAETQSKDPHLQAVALHTLSNWPDASVLDLLFQTARNTEERKYRYLALQGIVRLAGTSGFSDKKALGLLKDAMALASESDEKKLVLESLGNIRTAEALMIADRFLDDPAFRTEAAEVAARVALPAPGFEGLKGLETALILQKVLPFLDDPHDREALDKYIGGLLIREGYAPLFNGKDLSGWKGLVADPVIRAKMNPKKLKKAQAKADADMRLHWKVLAGILCFDGKGHSLCTVKEFRDFEMFVDWKIGPQGDSGIYLRGSPQVQIWDPDQWPEGSGGLYNNQIHPSKPERPADRPVGEWNTFRIRMAGERVTVHLNGTLVVDNVVMENYWERGKPIYPAGQIELQAHSTPLYFKNIFVKELPEEEAARTVPGEKR